MKDLAKSTLAGSKAGRQCPKKKLGIEVSILSFEDTKGYTEYTIRIRTKLFHYTFLKRYSEFQEFYNVLRRNYPQTFWPLLPKRMIFGNSDPDRLEARRKKLEAFLRDVVDMYLEDQKLREVAEFIELQNKNVRKISDISDSNLQLHDRCLKAYINLIYTKEKLQENVASFLALSAKNEMPRQVVQAILSGEGAVHSIFSEAFLHEEGCQESKMCLLKRQKSSFLSQGSHHTAGAVEDVRRTAPASPHIHYKCSVLSSCILFLFDPLRCASAALFRGLLFSTRMEYWLEAFREHLQSPHSTACRLNCYGLLKIFLELNNYCDLNTVFTQQAHKEQFQAWLRTIHAPQPGAKERGPVRGGLLALDCLVSNDVVSRQALTDCLGKLCLSERRNVLSHNTFAHYSHISLDVEKRLRPEFLSDILDMRWLSNVLQTFWADTPCEEAPASDVFGRSMVLLKSTTTSKLAIILCFCMYKVELPGKTVFFVLMETPDEKQKARYFHDYLQKNAQDALSHYKTAESKNVLFVVVEEGAEMDTVSVALVYDTNQSDMPEKMERFQRHRRELKNVKTIYDTKMQQDQQ